MMRQRLKDDLCDLMLIPGLSGHEDRVRHAIRNRLPDGVDARSDRLGNLIVSFAGDAEAPSVMVFTHMDQLGFIVRKIDEDGLIRVERMGGVPERALAAQQVLLCVGEGRDVPGLIANKSHHATTPDEKYQVVRAPDLVIDTGHCSRAGVEAAGVKIGTPVVYRPQITELAEGRIAGTSVDDRAGCAVLLEAARELVVREDGPTVHVVFRFRKSSTCAARLWRRNP